MVLWVGVGGGIWGYPFMCGPLFPPLTHLILEIGILCNKGSHWLWSSALKALKISHSKCSLLNSGNLEIKSKLLSAWLVSSSHFGVSAGGRLNLAKLGSIAFRPNPSFGIKLFILYKLRPNLDPMDSLFLIAKWCLHLCISVYVCICVCIHIYKSLSLLAWLRLMQFLIAFRELAAAAVFILNFLLFDPTVHPNKHRFNIFTSFAQNLYLRLNLLENQVNEEIIQNIS